MELELAPSYKRLMAALIDLIIIIAFFMIPIANFVLVIVYLLGRDSFKLLKGQSVGKKLLGIRVMNLNSKYDLMGDFQAGASRNLTHILLLDVFISLLQPQKQRFGDLWAKTVVVNDNKELRLYNKHVERDYKKYIVLSDPYDLYEYKPQNKVKDTGKHPKENYKVRRDWQRKYNQKRDPLRDYRDRKG